jgi:hypothetical protein
MLPRGLIPPTHSLRLSSLHAILRDIFPCPPFDERGEGDYAAAGIASDRGKLTGYDERTIRNILSGKPVRDQTIVDVCQVLGIEPELEQDHHIEIADEQFGAYEGAFFAYRRSFSAPSRLLRTVIEFAWSREGVPDLSGAQPVRERPEAGQQQPGRLRAHQPADGPDPSCHQLAGGGPADHADQDAGRGGGHAAAVLTQSEHRLFYQPSASPMVLTRIEQ